MHVAVKNGERKICYLLVSAGAPLLAVDKQDRTAQQIAEQTRDYDLAKYLECECTHYFVLDAIFRKKKNNAVRGKKSSRTTQSPLNFSLPRKHFMRLLTIHTVSLNLFFRLLFANTYFLEDSRTVETMRCPDCKGNNSKSVLNKIGTGRVQH